MRCDCLDTVLHVNVLQLEFYTVRLLQAYAALQSLFCLMESVYSEMKGISREEMHAAGRGGASDRTGSPA